jgi:hypothetical protein
MLGWFSKPNLLTILKLMDCVNGITDKNEIEERCGLPLQNKWRFGDEVDKLKNQLCTGGQQQGYIAMSRKPSILLWVTGISFGSISAQRPEGAYLPTKNDTPSIISCLS